MLSEEEPPSVVSEVMGMAALGFNMMASFSRSYIFSWLGFLVSIFAFTTGQGKGSLGKSIPTVIFSLVNVGMYYTLGKKVRIPTSST